MTTDLGPLARVLGAIKPYLPDIVLVGGWVPIAYEQCTPIYPTKTVRTADVDIACLSPLGMREEPIGSLLEEAGFRCQLHGSADIPFCRYVNDQDLEVEFLTPLKGDGSTAVTKLQEGLTAEALRYLDVLVDHTRPVKIEEGIVVRVPWLSAFLFQKGLSFPYRRSEGKSERKRDKDLYYVFKIVQTVEREYLMAELDQVSGAHPRKWRTTFVENLQKAFRDEHSDGVIAVVRQLVEIPDERDDPDILMMKVFVTMESFIADLK